MKVDENKLFLWVLGVLALLGLILFILYPGNGSSSGQQISFSGETMGTTYEVQIAGSELDDSQIFALKQLVDTELIAVNDAMSTYIPESEISSFNRLDAGIWIPVGNRFRAVLIRSGEIMELTMGAFDPTLGPLIDLWGFGAKSVEGEIPSQAQIQSALNEMGFDKLELGAQGLRKNLEGLEINLSAIAKGFGVDRLASLLRAEGYENVYVEIGGELFCAGVNGRGLPWQIGIQIPSMGASESAMKVVRLENAALATSGDYRNYVSDEKGLRHHILDPRTGRPASHTLASVSVITDDCMDADSLATAFFVMGTEEGLKLAEQLPAVEALFIDRREGEFELTTTEGFKQAIILVP